MRDVFTHRKGFPSPLLLLDYLDPEQAFNKRQSQVTGVFMQVLVVFCQDFLSNLLLPEVQMYTR